MKDIEDEITSPERKRSSIAEEKLPFLSSLFSDLVQETKRNLNSIKSLTQFSRERFKDAEFGNYFYKSVTENIEKINSVMEALLDYIRINTPMERTKTVHSVLEEVLKKHATRLEEKKVRITKKFEDSLPETTVQNEQLRFILSCIINYAILLIPPGGALAFLTKALAGPKVDEREIRYVEVLIVFTGYKSPGDRISPEAAAPSLEREAPFGLVLELARDMVRKNGGGMKVQTNELKQETLISLRLPAERRRVFYYRPTSE